MSWEKKGIGGEHTRTELFNLCLLVTGIEFVVVDFVSVGGDLEGGHDLLNFQTGSGGIEGDCLLFAVVLDVYFINLDVCIVDT